MGLTNHSDRSFDIVYSVNTLVERLGYDKNAKLVIIACDGYGSSNAANIAIKQATSTGIASTSRLQVPCPWAHGAVSQHRGGDIGVSLTLTAQYELYRWGPVTYAPSLLGGEGGFPRTKADLWEHADVDEVRRETRAQLERAIQWGITPSHLASHSDVLCGRPEFFDVFLDLAIEFNLPVTLPDPSIDLGFGARDLTSQAGVLVPDHVISTPWGVASRAAADEAIANLKPGVTEIQVHPATDSAELVAITPSWTAAVADAHLVTTDWTFRSALERSGAIVVGFNALERAQRTRS